MHTSVQDVLIKGCRMFFFFFVKKRTFVLAVMVFWGPLGVFHYFNKLTKHPSASNHCMSITAVLYVELQYVCHSVVWGLRQLWLTCQSVHLIKSHRVNTSTFESFKLNAERILHGVGTGYYLATLCCSQESIKISSWLVPPLKICLFPNLLDSLPKFWKWKPNNWGGTGEAVVFPLVK